jgi:hypothetical protein
VPQSTNRSAPKAQASGKTERDGREKVTTISSSSKKAAGPKRSTRQRPPSKRISFLVPVDTYDAIERESLRLGITMTEFLRKGAELYRIVSQPGTVTTVHDEQGSTQIQFL